jgi:signal transduction histidine kinase/ligand-binding sensor domain-containing protein
MKHRLNAPPAHIWNRRGSQSGSQPLRRHISERDRGRCVCRLRSVLLSAFLSLFLTGTASALDPHRFISQYAHTAWRTQDGFPRAPHMVTQTSDGYMWIAAGGGLLRFDGVTLTPVPSQKAFPTNVGINSLWGARDGSLWMATYRGLSRMKDGSAVSFSINRGGVQSILEDHAGTIWVTRSSVAGIEGALCQVIGESLRCFGKNKSDGNPAQFGTALAEDHSGDIWFGCQMLCRWTGASINHYLQEQIEHPSGDGITAIAAGPDGSTWAALDGVGPQAGVRYLSGGTFKSYQVPGFDGATVRALALLLDRHHTLWVGTQSQGLYHIHDGHADRYDASKGLTGNAVSSIYEDREGNLWITTDKGMDLFRDTPIVSYSSTEGLTGGDVSSVIALTDSSVLLGNEAALATIDPRSIVLSTTALGRPIQQVYGQLQDRSGQVWVGINQTVMRYELGKFYKIQGKDGRPLDSVGRILSLTEDTDGNIWAIAWDQPRVANHLLRIKHRAVQEDIQIASLVPHAHFLGADPAGGIWIATVDGALTHYLNGVTKLVSAPASSAPPIMMTGFWVDSAGVVWGATTGGLYRWDQGALSVMNSRNGLPCSAFYAVLKDDSGSLWLEAKCGLLRIAATDLANWIARPDSQVPATTLNALDGANPGWHEDRVQPNAAKSPDGRLWFTGPSSLQMVDPSRSYRNPLPPPVHIEGLMADGKSYGVSSPVSLPPLTRDLQIDYTALSFVMPQRMGFRYLLEGRDKVWQDPGSRRQAFYTDLRPGNYRFRVIASNNDGVWNRTGATLDFKIAPAWYQTNWFRWLCSVICLLLLWGIYRLRVRQIANSMRARFDERLAERTRIARDLHDTFLQTIQGSKLVADDALSPNTDLPRMRQTMEKLSAWLERATEEGRAALNSLRSSAAEMNDLAGAFQRAIEECRIQSSMDASLHVSGETREMHPIVRDEIYRIGYEAIRNACVHSQATQLRVELSYGQDLGLRVCDNGTGLDAEVLLRGKQGHFGLQSMRERAGRISGKLTIESSASLGTVVSLTVPGGIVYRK